MKITPRMLWAALLAHETVVGNRSATTGDRLEAMTAALEAAIALVETEPMPAAPHPDTELIDWLASRRTATINCAPTQFEVQTKNHIYTGATLRAALLAAKAGQ